MAAYTSNYQLHQWVPEDDFLRTDFNEDFAKIDAALGEAATESDLAVIRGNLLDKCRAYCGTFLGDGTASRVVNIGVRPYAVIVTSSVNMFATMIVGSTPLGPLSIVDNGFQTGTGGNIPQNESGKRYYFCCLR
ncbi:hypothetical protein [Flavonifractor sp. An10]|uniref:hypothetical protein n=1 Tax=Flavonifractor sp. An10 TaxID=1965537 RepID=UPI000B3AF9E4|nr:hypothetical protein [Flavonifractor sp. An10]OUQ82657.1 hypothetical protein B5E42_08170 [Flavonifractor sp. An10]